MTKERTSKSPLTLVVSRQSGLAERLHHLASRMSIESDDSESLRERFCRLTDEDGDRVMIVYRSELPEDPSDYLEELMCDEGKPSLIILADSDEPADRARLLAAGATKVVSASLTDEQLNDSVDSIAARIATGASGPEIRGNHAKAHISDFMSRSRSMQRLTGSIERVASANCSLLITGETGVGKERVARAIHELSPLEGRFVTVNCGAIPESLIESQLFGHEKGAFTGADATHKGYFEQARGGAIFLDEVGELPLPVQVKLLTVLQRHEVQRLGSEETVPIKARVLAATNRDLRKEIQEGRFREDLYYRINVINLSIPPLRNRVEDIPDLVGGLIHYFRCDMIKSEVESISHEALAAMLAYKWPGNIRELINVVERAMILGDDEELGTDDLPADISAPWSDGLAAPDAASSPSKKSVGDWLSRSLKEVREVAAASAERDYLDAALRHHGGRLAQVAKHAKIGVRSLYDKMQRHNLKKDLYRSEPQAEAGNGQ